MQDLEEAAESERALVAGSAPDDGELPRYLTNLCSSLLGLHARSGADRHLDEAIEVGRRAVAPSEIGPNVADRALANFGSALRERFMTYGRSADLDEAVVVCRRAGNVCPPHSPRHRVHLANLVDLLIERGQPDDVDEAVALAEGLVARTPPDHVDRAQVVSNLGRALCASADNRPADQHDLLRRAAACEQEALTLLGDRNIQWPRAAANVAKALVDQGDESDLDRALDLILRVLDRTPLDDRALAWRLQVLAITYEARVRHQVGENDKNKALAAWRSSACAVASPAGIRLQSAVRGAEWALHVMRRHGDALDGYRNAIALLDRLAWRGLDRVDQESLLSRWPTLTGTAVALAIDLGDVESAAQVAEHGRAVLWSQLLTHRGDLQALADREPVLAARLSQVTNALDGPPGSSPPRDGVDAPLATDVQGSISRRFGP
ncbi:MAG: hypothetical protein AB7V44_02320 [Pseudonocardia sp.]